MDRYTLRWRFDYLTRPSKAGMWGLTTRNKVDSAWSQPRDGMIRACIEGKNLRTREIKMLAECRGCDFRVFQWLATALCPIFPGGTRSLKSKLVGLKMLTRDEQVTVLYDGSVQVEPLSESLRELNFKTY